jgi:hypothetical protein
MAPYSIIKRTMKPHFLPGGNFPYTNLQPWAYADKNAQG